MSELSALLASLKEDFPGLVARGEGLDSAVSAPVEAARPLLERLKTRGGFNVLVDLTAVDYSRFAQGGKEPAQSFPERFKAVYRLMRLDAASGLVSARLAVEVWLAEGRALSSARDLWPCADWLERELWDMFGIPFSDRPAIKRLLLYEEFSGHPLRKDYPIDKRQPLIGPKDGPERDRMLSGDLRPKIA